MIFIENPHERSRLSREVRGDGHVPGAWDEIPKPVVVALLKAPVVVMRTIIGRFALAAQLLEDIYGPSAEVRRPPQ